jgi:hypothetical protein
MTGTNCDLFTHKSSRSYLNHLVIKALLSDDVVETSLPRATVASWASNGVVRHRNKGCLRMTSLKVYLSFSTILFFSRHLFPIPTSQKRLSLSKVITRYHYQHSCKEKTYTTCGEYRKLCWRKKGTGGLGGGDIGTNFSRGLGIATRTLGSRS